MSAEKIVTQETPREIKREDFAPGVLGDMAYRIVTSGEPCVTYIDSDKNKCGKPPMSTVDIDIRGNVELFPVCEEHPEALKNQLHDDILSIGSFTTSAYNGNGRGYDRAKKPICEDQQT